MIDIHSHLVPGVDDGSQSINESLELLNLAIGQGVTHMILTPHNDAFNYFDVKKKYFALNSETLKRKMPIQLYLGSEILCSTNSVKDNIRKIKENIYPTLNGTNYILIEFNPFNSSIEDALYCVRSIIDGGYKPVIAHVERYSFSCVENIALFKKEGAMIQINAYSLEDENLPKVKRLARDLMQNQMVEFIGSDAHRLGHRPIMVKNGIDYAYNTFSKNYVNKVMFENSIDMLIGG